MNKSIPIPGFDHQDFFENAPIGIFTSTPGGRYISANSALSRMYGYDSPGELIESVADIATQVYAVPEDRKEFLRLLEEHGEVTNHECRMLRRDGSVCWVSRNARAVRDEDGCVIAYQGFTTDISSQKLAEERERKDEERFRLMFMNAPMPYQSLDEQGNFLDVNQAFLDVFGYTRAELIGMNFGDILHPDWVDHFKQNFPRFKAVGEVLGVEFEMVKKDGSTILVHFNGKIQHDDQGRFQRTHCIFQDVTERKRAEEALLKSESILKDILESTLSGYWDWNLAENTEYLSPTFKRMFGYEDHEMESSPEAWQKIIFPEDLPGVLEVFDRHVKSRGREPFYNEVRYRHRDDSTVWVICAGRVVEWTDDGRPIRMVGCHMNITKRKLSEEALSKSQKIMAQAEELAGMGSWEWDIQNDTWLLSDNWKRIHGVPDIQLKTAQLLRIAHPEDRPAIEEAFARATQNGEPYDIEHRIVRQNTGDVRHVHSRGLVAMDNNGRPGSMVGAVQDITERKKSEEQLRKHSMAVEQSPASIVITDPQANIEYVNPAFTNLTGYAFDEVIGQNPRVLKSSDKRPEDYRELWETLTSGKQWRGEFKNIKKNGEVFWEAASIAPVLNEQGQTTHYLAVKEDITDRKLAEKALLAAKEQAESANQAKSAFLANMSHELRTPLNGVMGIMQLLQMTELDQEQQRWVSMAIKSSDRLARLLTDILDISRIEAGKMELVDEEFNLKELCDSICEVFVITSTQDKDVRLECIIDAAMPQKLIGDTARVRQVLFNLVGNAHKFTEKGKVNVEMVPLSSYRQGFIRVLFSVSDTGIGIPEDRLNDLFKPFVQVDGSYTRRYQGAGLGLSIVKRLVDLMGGSINIDSSPGAGTTVYFVLPFKLPEGVSIPVQHGLNQVPETSQKLRILLAEDEPSNAVPIRILLGKAGHAVTLAEDGQQALNLLVTQDFDVILMDVQMPVMNGVEATKAIRSSTDLGPRKDIPIIALTAYAMTGDREKFLEAGMNDYLAKPVGMEDLAKVLERVVSSAKK